MFFDKKILEDFLNALDANDRDLLLNFFLYEIEQKASDCVVAKNSQDIEKLQSHSHILKSNAMTIGAICIGKTAEEIEKACINGKKKNAFDLCDHICDLAKQTIQAIKEHI